MGGALALSLVLVAYNNGLNAWPPFHSWAYVPCNLVLTAAALAVFGARPPWGDTSDVLLGLGLAAPVVLGLLAVSAGRYRRLIADERVAGLAGWHLTYHLVLRIPLGTAVSEEVLFRGVLVGAWRAAGQPLSQAALWSALAFGLWHIAPTVIGVRRNDPQASLARLIAAVIGAVVVTSLAGLGLTWLRLESEGLAAPVALHAAVNSGAALAAVRARRAGP